MRGRGRPRSAAAPSLAVEAAGTAHAFEIAFRSLANRGRLLVRYSGTESKLRVMVEAENGDRLEEYVSMIEEAVVAELGRQA